MRIASILDYTVFDVDSFVLNREILVLFMDTQPNFERVLRL